MSNPANEAVRPAGDRPCPICKSSMVDAAHEGLRADLCKEHGVWLDDGELQRILAKARRQPGSARRRIDSARSRGVVKGLFWGMWAMLDDGSPGAGAGRSRKIPDAFYEKNKPDNATIVPEGARPCPVCDEVMKVEASNNVVIDCCEEHGVWLDDDELAKMIGRARNRSRIKTRRSIRRAHREGVVDANLFGLFALLR